MDKAIGGLETAVARDVEPHLIEVSLSLWSEAMRRQFVAPSRSGRLLRPLCGPKREFRTRC